MEIFEIFLKLLGDVEDMADILLTKAKDIDLTEGCRDCGGCEMGNTGGASKSRSVFCTVETPNKGLLAFIK